MFRWYGRDCEDCDGMSCWSVERIARVERFLRLKSFGKEENEAFKVELLCSELSKKLD
jgi:hypothetical protein